MPGYIKEARQCFNHLMPAKLQDSPYPHTPPKYGAKIQYADEQDTSQLLYKEGKRYIQRVCGTFLYLARAVYTTCLTPLTRLEYLKLKMRDIPDEIIKLYNLNEK